MSYMTTKEAAALWGCSETTVRKWCKDGLVYSVQRAEKKSGRWRIPVDAARPQNTVRRKNDVKK